MRGHMSGIAGIIQVYKSPESVEDRIGRSLFCKRFESRERDDFQSVVNLLDNKRRVGLLESLMVPVRTDNMRDFCTDFFFPGLFNEALKTRDVVEKVLLVIILGVVDIATLPVRLITVIPRCMHNSSHSKQSHPFYRYLINNGVAPDDLSEPYVYLKVASFSWCLEGDQEGTNQGQYNMAAREETFNFVELPKKASSIRSVSSDAWGVPEEEIAQFHV